MIWEREVLTTARKISAILLSFIAIYLAWQQRFDTAAFFMAWAALTQARCHG